MASISALESFARGTGFCNRIEGRGGGRLDGSDIFGAEDDADIMDKPPEGTDVASSASAAAFPSDAGGRHTKYRQAKARERMRRTSERANERRRANERANERTSE